MDWYCSNDNLLTSLQNLALIGGGDFDLVKADMNVGPLNWDFRFYPGQLGADRSATLTFATGRGNMINPQRDYNLENEATVAIVGGAGQQANRDYLTRTGTNYGANNDIEMFVSDSSQTTAGRQAAGDKRLAALVAKEVVQFGIKQTDNCVYKVNFNLGDLAKAVNPFTGTASTVKIYAVIIDQGADGLETISGEVATP